jgi:hypothetical protein
VVIAPPFVAFLQLSASSNARLGQTSPDEGEVTLPLAGNVSHVRSSTTATRLRLGTPVGCTDGPFGEVTGFVIDPVGTRVTHLVAAPKDRSGQARLAPIELAERTGRSRSSFS